MNNPPKYEIGDLVIGLQTYSGRIINDRKWIIKDVEWDYYLSFWRYKVEEYEGKGGIKLKGDQFLIEEQHLVVAKDGNNVLKGML